MTEVDDFIALILPRMTEMDTALHKGDAGPRKAFWSHNDPVTLPIKRLHRIASYFEGINAAFARGRQGNFIPALASGETRAVKKTAGAGLRQTQQGH